MDVKVDLENSMSPEMYALYFNPLSPTLFLIVAKMSVPKHLVPYWSNPPFLFFWHSGTLALSVPECQKIKKGGIDQYGPERFKV